MIVVRCDTDYTYIYIRKRGADKEITVQHFVGKDLNTRLGLVLACKIITWMPEHHANNAPLQNPERTT